MDSPALLFRDVSIRYDSASPRVVSGASFSIAPGERVALVGLNGAGKTTLLMAVAGLVPHEGTIQVGETVVSRSTLPEIRERIGFLFNVPEDQLLFPTVIDDASFGLLRQGIPPAEASLRARSLLAALGADGLAEMPVHRLSHGQKLRVALAGALVTNPPLLLLDEPSAGLDPPGRRELGNHLRQLPAALLIATHDLDFAERLCTRYIRLEPGRLLGEGVDFSELRRKWDRLD